MRWGQRILSKVISVWQKWFPTCCHHFQWWMKAKRLNSGCFIFSNQKPFRHNFRSFWTKVSIMKFLLSGGNFSTQICDNLQFTIFSAKHFLTLLGSAAPFITSHLATKCEKRRRITNCTQLALRDFPPRPHLTKCKSRVLIFCYSSAAAYFMTCKGVGYIFWYVLNGMNIRQNGIAVCL